MNEERKKKYQLASHLVNNRYVVVGMNHEEKIGRNERLAQTGHLHNSTILSLHRLPSFSHFLPL